MAELESERPFSVSNLELIMQLEQSKIIIIKI